MNNEKKRILFDLIAMEPNATGSKFHGAADYAKNVLWYLSTINKNNIIDCFFTNNNIPEMCKDIVGENDNIIYIRINKKNEVEDLLLSNNYYTFFSALPYDYTDIKIPQTTKFVFTIHGLRKYEMPFDWNMIYYQKAKFNNYLRYIWDLINREKRATQYINQIKSLINLTENRIIITVSEHSKYSILLTCKNVNENEIEVLHTPSGLREIINKENKENSFNYLKKWGIEEKKYFLMISCNRWIKNCYRAVKAFDKMFDERPELLKGYKVVLLGITNECRYIHKIKNKDKFIFEGYVEDEDLRDIYSRAYAFVYPTLNEGYGYPPIESMGYNIVPMCAANSSIIEVCKDAACYFNSYNIKEIMNRIYQIMNKKKYEEYLKKGNEHYLHVKELQNKDLIKIANIILDHRL